PIVPPPMTVIADSFIWLFLLSLSFQASFYEPSLDTAFQKLGSNGTQKMLSTPSIVLIQNDFSVFRNRRRPTIWSNDGIHELRFCTEFALLVGELVQSE